MNLYDQKLISKWPLISALINCFDCKFISIISEFVILKLGVRIILSNYLSDYFRNVPMKSQREFEKLSIYCLLEAGDIVTLPMKSVSLVVAYSSKLFRKMFHTSGSSQMLSVDWHRSKRCIYFVTFNLLNVHKLFKNNTCDTTRNKCY